MAQSLARIVVHAIFSTKNRERFLRDKRLLGELHRYIGGVLHGLDCAPLVVGGTEDHVHVLCHLSRTCEPAGMIKEVKRASSLWLKERAPGMQDFAWQGGYAIFSIGVSQIEAARKYISNQEEHHKKISFQAELREFLRRHEVEFDERFVWD